MIAAFAFIVLLSASLLFADDLPDSVDWRGKGIMSEIREEGKCKSSWAIATACVIEAHYAKEHGKFKELSIQQLIDCVDDPEMIDGCRNGSVHSALNWLFNKHAGLMNNDEYMSRRSSTGIDICRWNETAEQVRIIG